MTNAEIFGRGGITPDGDCLTSMIRPFPSILASRARLIGALVAASLACGANPARAQDAAGLVAEAPFVQENEAAMSKMMAGMEARPTGNVDSDFVAMMIPHHQGAIDMAVAELRYGHDEQLKRIAQEIIVDQQQEIVAMRLALGQSLPPPSPAPTQPPASQPLDGPSHHHHDMTAQDKPQ